MPDFQTSVTADPIQAEGEIRMIAALTTMSDERIVLNSYAEDNPQGIQLMAKVTNLADVWDKVHEFGATVLVIDHLIGQGVDSGELLVSVIQRLRHNPEHPVITIGVCYDPVWHKTFIEAGALGTINGPITRAEIARLNAMLPSAMKKAYQERLDPNYVARFSEDAVRVIDSGKWERSTIAVWGPKGGIGKSFVALNMAVALGTLCDRRTLLIDADMNCGDIATYLNLECTDRGLFKLASLFHANKMLSPLLVQQCLTPYFLQGGRPSNLQVLIGAYKMGMAGDAMFTGARGKAFSTALMEVLPLMGFDFVIFDLGQSFHHPMHFVPLQRATTVLVVATSEKATALELVHALPELKMVVQGTPDKPMDPRRFRLLINRYDERLGVDPKELVKMIGNMPEWGRIPEEEDCEVALSLNHSKPLILEKPGRVAEGIISTVMGFYRPIESVWKSRGGMGRPNQSKPRFKLKFALGGGKS
jgi:pilus assembly protein CpaE